MATFTWASLTRPLAPISFIPAAPPRSLSPPPNPEEGQKAKDFYESVVNQRKPNIFDKGHRRRNEISVKSHPLNIKDKCPQNNLGEDRSRMKRRGSDENLLELVNSGQSTSSADDEPVAGTSYDILIDEDDNDDWRRKRQFKREPQFELSLSSFSSSSSRIPRFDSYPDLKVKIEDDCDVKVKAEQNPSSPPPPPFAPPSESRLDPKSIKLIEGDAAAATDKYPRPLTTTTTKSNSAFEAKRMRYRFFLAAQKDNLAELDLCLRKGVGANELDDFGWSALMIASSAGSLGVARHLVEIGADNSISTSGGLTALDLAKAGKFPSERKYVLTELLRESAEEEKEDDDDDVTIESTVAGRSSTEVIQFCEACDSCFAETESAHSQSVSHLLRVGGVEGAKRQDLSVFGIGEGNRGFRLMVDTMGWDANSGLGKEGEGRRYPIKTQPKSDRKGLGVDKEKKKTDREWTKTDKDSSKKGGGGGEESAQSRLGRGVAARLMTQRTLSRKEARREEMRNKRWEKNLRRYLSE